MPQRNHFLSAHTQRQSQPQLYPLSPYEIKILEAPEKLSDRTAEEENVRNRLYLLKLQLAELKGKGSYVTISFHRTKITSTCRGGRYEHFYRIRFLTGITNYKKSSSEAQRSSRFLSSLSRFFLFFLSKCMFGDA
ncbi:uncharacterized protein DS421_13g409790 [Arachis hypogaea]|nr:uncharacterized protein DS421_13g409790 [Arachis hypogaea]